MIDLFNECNDFCNDHGVFHICVLNGEEYYFTEERIKDEDMPKGLYKADIRAKWGTDEWATIEPLVAVDHIATIISDKPFAYTCGDQEKPYTPIKSCELYWDEEMLDGIDDEDDDWD